MQRIANHKHHVSFMQHRICVGTEATKETFIELEVEYTVEPEQVDP